MDAKLIFTSEDTSGTETVETSVERCTVLGGGNSNRISREDPGRIIGLGGLPGSPNGAAGGDSISYSSPGAGGTVPALANGYCTIGSYGSTVFSILSTVGRGGNGSNSALVNAGNNGQIVIAFYGTGGSS